MPFRVPGVRIPPSPPFLYTLGRNILSERALRQFAIIRTNPLENRELENGELADRRPDYKKGANAFNDGEARVIPAFLIIRNPEMVDAEVDDFSNPDVREERGHSELALWRAAPPLPPFVPLLCVPLC